MMVDYIVDVVFFFFQAEDGIRDYKVTGVQTCALPIYAFDFARLAVVDAERGLAVDRRAQYGAVQHAQYSYVDAVAGLSAHFVRHLDARNVLADEAKLARPLELLARELRRAGRDHGELRDLAVGELAPRRLVHDGIRLGAELAGRHLPFERRALDHDLARLHAREPHHLVIAAGRARSPRKHVAAEQGVAEQLWVVRRLLDANAAPVEVHLLGDEQRHGGHHALPHFAGGPPTRRARC